MYPYNWIMGQLKKVGTAIEIHTSSGSIFSSIFTFNFTFKFWIEKNKFLCAKNNQTYNCKAHREQEHHSHKPFTHTHTKQNKYNKMEYIMIVWR